MGGRFTQTVDREVMTYSATVLKADVPKAMAVLADAVKVRACDPHVARLFGVRFVSSVLSLLGRAAATAAAAAAAAAKLRRTSLFSSCCFWVIHR